MKMMSNTSITSTIGVTLMSEVTFAASFRFAKDMEFSLLHTLAQTDPPNLLVERRASPPDWTGETPVHPFSNSWVPTLCLS
jgi:hypothetical protein